MIKILRFCGRSNNSDEAATRPIWYAYTSLALVSRNPRPLPPRLREVEEGSGQQHLPASLLFMFYCVVNDLRTPCCFALEGVVRAHFGSLLGAAILSLAYLFLKLRER